MKIEYENWIFEIENAVELKVTELTWIDTFFPHLNDIHVSIIVDGVEWEGRGHANNINIGIQKAVSEAVERAVCLDYLDSTNGIASHFIERTSEKNALNELIERDLFLNHFLTNTPLEYATELTSLLSPKILDFVKTNKDQIRIFKMRGTNLGTGIVCLIDGNKKWGGIVGLSFGRTEDLPSLVMKSVLEAFRQYWHRFTRDSLNDCIMLDKFLAQNEWTFVDHGKLFLNLNYFDSVSHLFPSINIKDEYSVKYDSSEFHFQTFEKKSAMLKECPLFVKRCYSPNVQNLKAGPTKVENLSQYGISRFLGYAKSTLNLLPHPIN